MAREPAYVWTAAEVSWLGKMPDAEVARRIGRTENIPRDRRVRLGIPTFRSTRGSAVIPCANCGAEIRRKMHALERSKRLFCSRVCADAGQKRRDSETLRYGPGWKNRRAEIRARDKACRACGKTPEMNGAALHVHHLKPYRFGGTNRTQNLVALCDPCHHRIEAATTAALESIQIDVRLDASSLTISVDNAIRWRGSVAGAGSPTATG